ncbi:MAG: RuBisCO large subunit C-terminal-like domain-containing protein [Nanoarchaeota archaeon]
MIDDYLFQPEVDKEEHIIATYYVESKNFFDACKGIAIGQSIGNPNVRVTLEDERMMKENLAKILDIKSNLLSRQEGIVKIAYPIVNLDIPKDGITQLLCTLMGGQMDIDIIASCKLLDVELPRKYKSHFKGPKYGLYEIKQRTGAVGRPLLGGIVKPKTGLNINQLKEVVMQLLKGGVDFIKEDEMLGNPSFCSFEERVSIISKVVNDFCKDAGKEVFYCPCINADYPYFLERAKFAEKEGVRGVHLNIWAGLPAYKALRDQDLKLAIFFQKSGDKVMTDREHKYSIDWKVVCQIARMIGVDFIHAGMWGGYLSDSKEKLSEIFNVLIKRDVYKPVVPSLSCGSHPGLVDSTVKNFGTDLMMNVGGAIHGHPMGTEAGAKAMRDAFDCEQSGQSIQEFMQSRSELKKAIEKWGYIE